MAQTFNVQSSTLDVQRSVSALLVTYYVTRLGWRAGLPTGRALSHAKAQRRKVEGSAPAGPRLGLSMDLEGIQPGSLSGQSLATADPKEPRRIPDSFLTQRAQRSRRIYSEARNRVFNAKAQRREVEGRSVICSEPSAFKFQHSAFRCGSAATRLNSTDD